MSIDRLMARFEIGTRIYAGFGVVVFLLVAIAAISYLGFQENRAEVERYVYQSDQVIAVGDEMNDVERVRRQVRTYATTGEREVADLARKGIAHTMEELQALEGSFKSAERKQTAKEMMALLKGYGADFEKTVEARTRRDSLVEQSAALGGRIMTDLSTVIEAAEKSNDFANTASAVDAYQAVALARLAVLRHLANADMSQAEALKAAALKEISRLIAETDDLSLEVKDPALQKLAAATHANAVDYEKTFNQRKRCASDTYFLGT